MTQRESKKICKLIVRQLPPTLTEDAFLSTLPPNTLTNSIDFYYYTLGKFSEKRPINSTAYLHFKTEELAKEFTSIYQGHVFINSKGKETRASVDVAPFQKIPRANKKRTDSKENTIDQDPSFLEFVESLNVPQVFLPSAEEQLDKRLAEQAASGITSDTPIITPLIAYVRLRKSNRGKGMPSKIAILKRDGKKERRQRKEKGPKGEKKEDKPLDPNKKKNRRRDREDRKKKKREAEKEGAVEGEANNAASSTDPSAQAGNVCNPPQKRERPPRKERGGNGEEGGKGRGNGMWQRKQNLEPGTVSIQPRAPNAEGSSDSTSSNYQPKQLKPKGRGAPLNGNAASFVSSSITTGNSPVIREPLPMNPAAAPVIPAAYLNSHIIANGMEATSAPFIPSGIVLNGHIPNGSPTGNGNNAGRRRGGRGGGGNKESKFKVYTPKPQIPTTTGT
eukprot:TRINITY_DN3619_c0_g1_i6.p1 TRINITY_DN3619_c0_g1~~TRINITY_DN3619_c0_g1_i6.p1  ORF type:complete len:448 (-),score=195.50 TRINITY_DN3619_c0_g1_i6:469-1812(-)